MLYSNATHTPRYWEYALIFRIQASKLWNHLIMMITKSSFLNILLTMGE